MIKHVHRRATTALWLMAAAAVAAPAVGAIGDAARLIPVQESPIVLALWEEADAGGTQVPHYAISLDGVDFVRACAADYRLGLRLAQFDPLAGEPTVPADLAARDDVNLYLVQFVTQPLEVYADAIEGLGGIIRHYVAQYAYLVEMNGQARAQVAQLPYVRWVGRYHPAYRLEEFLLDNHAEAARFYPLARYNVMVLDAGQRYAVGARIERIGGIVERLDAGKLVVEATLTPEQLFAVIRWDEVLFVDRWSPFEMDMNIAREIGGADYIETVAGFAGAGVRGEVFDGGFNMGHHDFQSRPLIQHGPTGTNSHGAATSGICFGDGAGQWIARGLLPEGQGVIADYNYVGMTGPSRYNHTGQLVQPPYECVFQTASVGSNRTTLYTTISAETDVALFDFDIVHCQSQSNAGDQMSRPQAWAKNMLSVGGVYHYNNNNRADDRWNHGASIGPASDGRIKPDLWHFYDWIYTTDCCGYESYTPSFGGTSGATPIVAGHVGLVHQMWAEGIFGNQVIPGGTVFENRPHMTTPKALLIASAYQYNFSGLLDDKARCHQGWGMPDLRTLYDMRGKIYVVDQTDVLEAFEMGQHLLTVDVEEPVLKIVMDYPDPPGNPGVQTQHRINDLTLRVTSPGGEVYWGNNNLYDQPWSLPGGVPDTKNTVECVFVQQPEPGNWTIDILCDELIQDGYVATPEMDAVYSLVAMGGFGQDWSAVAVDDRPAAPLELRSLGAVGSSAARLAFALPSASPVQLTIHDVTGRKIATLVDGVLPAGDHEISWNGSADAGTSAQRGIYFARLTAAGQETSRKLMVVQ